LSRLRGGLFKRRPRLVRVWAFCFGPEADVNGGWLRKVPSNHQSCGYLCEVESKEGNCSQHATSKRLLADRIADRGGHHPDHRAIAIPTCYARVLRPMNRPQFIDSHHQHGSDFIQLVLPDGRLCRHLARFRARAALRRFDRRLPDRYHALLGTKSGYSFVLATSPARWLPPTRRTPTVDCQRPACHFCSIADLSSVCPPALLPASEPRRRSSKFEFGKCLGGTSRKEAEEKSSAFLFARVLRLGGQVTLNSREF